MDRDFWLTLASLAWFALAGVLVGVTNAYLDYASPYVNIPVEQRGQMYDPLLQFLFRYIGIHFPKRFPDMLVSLAPVVIAVRVLLGGENKCTLLRRACWMVGAGYLIRIPFTLMTVLPNSNLNCTSTPNPNFFLYALELSLQMKKSCGDVVFSGHTVMFMSSCLLWHHNPIKFGYSQLINFLIWCYALTGVLSLIAATSHYTLDCVLSLLTMLFLWKLYHFTLYNESLRRTNVSWVVHHLDGSPEFLYQRLSTLETTLC